MKITDKYVLFFGPEDCPSQWYPVKFKTRLFDFENLEFNCSEQFMMAAKALFFDDKESFVKIMNTSSPNQQKSLGRNVQGFDKDKWNAVCRPLVTVGNMAKFTQNDDLKQFMLDNEGKIFVEASPYDDIWGVKLGANDPRILDPSKWRGTNWLGEILTRINIIICKKEKSK